MPRDYYEVLGVEKGSDAASIKKAYRKAALQYHPDRNPDDPDAEAKFKEVSEAYSVLSDDEKRRVYDQFGHDGLRGRGFDPNFTDLSDIFSAFGDLFGFGGFGGRGGRRGPRPGADLEYPLRLEFMEAALGVEKTIEIPKHVHCGTCTGTGLKEGASKNTCSTCGGAGQVIQAQGFLRIRTTCPACRGQGQSVDAGDRCDTCKGSGRIRKTDTLQVKIPAGSYTGLQIRHPGRGEVGDPGAPTGDLYVTLDVKPHEVFKRDGADTYVSVPVPFPVMALGGTINVPTVHGEEELEVKRGTESGHVETLRGKGLDRLRARGSKGDHHVRLVVDVPTKLTDKQEELLRKLAETLEVGVREKGFWQKLFG
ncbi:MAG: molecular chaperone DnaJ [Myxococcota bacterium]